MSETLSVIAGLGNPGEKYRATRHNAGFRFADALAARHGSSFSYQKRFDADTTRIRLGPAEVWLVKPRSYMNASGAPLRALLDYYRLSPSAMLVAHDDLDLEPGTVRLKQGGGHGGHNGLRDVIAHCGADFLRLRLGIGHPGGREQVLGYVLRAAGAEEEAAMRDARERGVEAMPLLVEDGPAAVMNRLHRRSAASAGDSAS